MMAELDILNGFVGKVISDCIDISISAIKKADKNRKSKNQTMETRIYQVTIDALNVFPYNKYKKEEKVYDAAESILKELKGGNGNCKESVRVGLNMLSSDITEDVCEDFLELLCYEICKEENQDLAIGHIIFQGEKISEQQQQMDRHMQEGFRESCQNEKEILEGVSDIKENLNREKNYKTEKNNEKPVENKARYYADKWNRNVFLNDFDEEDENNGINIKLKDIYKEVCLPHYVWRENPYPSENSLKDLLKKYIIDNQKKKILLILGQPGIGKSTLITWIMINFQQKRDEIFVFQFAHDLKKINWQGDDILDAIFETLHLRRKELENKVIILDGFDEICISGNREGILNKLNRELEVMDFPDNLSIIITCRKNYVNCSNLVGNKYITLQAWDKEQIKSFCKIYEKVSTKEISQAKIDKILENQEIFGIPLILYMILALDITIEKSSSIADIYEQIFSLENGSVYDRCVKKGCIITESYERPHRISTHKKQIHKISKMIAFWIFENNSEKAFISQEKFKEICKSIDKDIERDALIGNYFNLIHCEGMGTGELYFVHRTIYEYFVAVYFFESLEELKEQYKTVHRDKIAGKLGELLKEGYLSKQILEFIKYKFENVKEYNLADTTKEIFNIMLEDGMKYYANIVVKDGMNYHEQEQYRDIMDREMNICANMLEVIHLWNYKVEKINDKIVSYMRYNYQFTLNLKGIKLNKAYLVGINLSGSNLRKAGLVKANLSKADLSGTDLSEAILTKANLSEANLSNADLVGAEFDGANLEKSNLSRANLSGVKFNGANLSGANLNGANLNGASLEGAILSKTIFDEKQIEWLCEKYNLNKSKVFLSKTEEIINYTKCCMSKRKKRI